MIFVARLKAIFFKNNKYFNNYGLNLFHLGIILLGSAPAIAIVIFIFSSIFGSINRKDYFFEDKYNYPFLIASILMIISCIFISLNNNLILDKAPNPWIGLSNWLPFFWCFWSFQKYLCTQNLRLKSAQLLIIGTLPILVSCFCQFFLKIYGPFRIFNNLIVWYQRPLGSDNGVTGLFNNQNYAGAWLCIILPLCLFFLIKKHKHLIIKSYYFIVSTSVVYIIILTTSRNAIFSIFITIFLFTKSIKTKILSLFTLILIPLFLNLIPYISLNLRNFINIYIPFELVKKTSLTNLSNIYLSPRFEIWDKAIMLIKSKLFIGYGAGSFNSIYTTSGGNFKGIQHAHNIFLELAFSHGLFTGVIIISMMIYLILFSWKSYTNQITKLSSDFKTGFYYFDKAWIISFTIFFLIQMSDITYFDGRISILAWILLAGMTANIKENNPLKIYKDN